MKDRSVKYKALVHFTSPQAVLCGRDLGEAELIHQHTILKQDDYQDYGTTINVSLSLRDLKMSVHPDTS